MERSVDTLDIPKNAKNEAKRLGYYNYSDLRDHSEDVQVLNHSWESVVQAPEMRTAFDIYKEELLNGHILTYNEKLDNLLNSVIQMKSVTEITGGPGCGKTQLCFTLCISVQFPKWCGGNGGQAVYIGTNRNFFPNRLRGLAEKFVSKYNSVRAQLDRPKDEFDEEFIMRNIHCVNIESCVELFASLVKLDTYLENRLVKLLVIDSITQPLKLLDGEDRLSVISELFLKLRRLGAKYNIAVVLTNDLTQRVNDAVTVITPSLGDSFYHMVNTRIVLHKNSYGFRAVIEKGFPKDIFSVNFSI